MNIVPIILYQVKDKLLNQGQLFDPLYASV